MENRFVRWTIYLLVGVAIGVGINYYNNKNKIDEGVVELSPDVLQEEGTFVPSRDIEEDGELFAPADDMMEGFVDDVKEAGEVLEGAGEAAMDSVNDMMSSEEDMIEEEAAEENMDEEEAPALTPMPQ